MNFVKCLGALLVGAGLVLFARAAEVSVVVGERQILTYAMVNGERVPMWHEGPVRVMLSLSRDATCSFHGIDADGKAIQIGESVEVTDEGETISEDERVREVAVDTRTEKAVDVSAGPVTVNLTYSGGSWGEAVGGNAAIAVAFEGGAEQPFASGLTGEGTVPWEPKRGGTYVFRHTAGGVTETATFKAVGFLGEVVNPWLVGAGDAAAVKAYVKDGYLYLEGDGEVTEFGDGVPWAGLGDMLVGAILPRTVTLPASVLATLPISVKGEVEPLGFVKTDGFSAIAVNPATQEATLSVVVCKTESLDKPEWKPVSTNGIPVKADTSTGFFIVAPAAPSDLDLPPIVTVK